jgi:glycerol-3-phosphate dehydrogenase (NAD(P)+)
MSLRIAVIGLGAWGSTLAALFEQQGHSVHGWSRRQGGEPAEVLTGADLALMATSLVGVQALAPALAGRWPTGLPLISCSKGIDLQQQCTPSQLWSQLLPELPLLVLSGPNLASELAAGLPAASVLAGRDQALAEQLQRALSNDRLRLYTNTDPVGTEVAGALKNVMAIAGGACDGLKLGANAKASLLCRGLVEMGVVIQGLGGDRASLYGLAGLGDLLATANSVLSRNYRFGLALAEGLSATDALERVGATVEGAQTAKAVNLLAERHGWHLPICEQVGALMAGSIRPEQAVRRLMERNLKPEELAFR